MNTKTRIALALLLATLFGALALFAWPSPEPGAVIRISDEGFTPARLTVERGTRVRFVNEGTTWHWPASNSHPTHELYPAFDPREPIAPGEYWDLASAEQGTWGFHDHLYPQLRGILTVE